MEDKSASRLSAILQNVINSEINLRSGDLNLVEQNINAVREALNRLRRAVCADFYDDNSKTTLQKPPHRTVKSTFAGKRPIKREVVTSEDETSSTIPASTFSPAIPQSADKCDLVQIKVEKQEEVVEETNRANSVALAESSLKYVDPDEKQSLLGRSDKGPRPRYVPPVMPINHIKHGLAPRLAERMKKVRILVRNNSKFLGNGDGSSGGLYRWTVYVTLNDLSLDISQLVSKVVFYLHPSYRPNDVVTIGCLPFKITRRGWGEFDIRTKIFFINEADEPVDIMHAVVFDKLRSGMETFGGETIFDHWITNPSSSNETGVKNTTSECLERITNNPVSMTIKKEPVEPTDLDNFLDSKLSTNKFNYNFGDIGFTEFFDLFDNENTDGPLKLSSDSLISEENLVPCKEESVVLESDKEKNVESNFVEKVNETPELQLDDNHKTVNCQSTKSSSEMPNAESFDLDDILGTCNEVVITDTCDSEIKTEPEYVHVETDKAISSSKDVTEHIDYDNVKMEDLIKFPKILDNSSSDSSKTIQRVDLTPLKSLSAPLQPKNIATCAKTNVVNFIPATTSSPTSIPRSNLKFPIRQNLVPLQTRPTGPQPVKIINVTPKSAAAASAGTKCYIKMPDGSLKQIILKSSVMPKVSNLKVASPICANVTSDRIITPNTSKPVLAIKRAGAPIVGPPVKILRTNAVVKVAGNVINSSTNPQLQNKQTVQLVRCDKGKVLSSSNVVVSPQVAKVIRPGTNIEQKRPQENEEVQNVNVVEREILADRCPKISLESGIIWLLKKFPLIGKRAESIKSAIPYCALDYDTFNGWPLAKKRAHELQRVNDVMEVAKMVFPRCEWTKYDVLRFARLRGFTPHFRHLDPNFKPAAPSSIRDVPTLFDFKKYRNLSCHSEGKIDVTAISRGTGKSTPVNDKPISLKGKTLMTLGQHTSEAQMVEKLIEDISIYLDPEEIEEGVVYPAALRLLLTAYKCFAEDLIRRSYTSGYLRFNSSEPDVVLREDVRTALHSRPEFDLFTNEGTGIVRSNKPNELTHPGSRIY